MIIRSHRQRAAAIILLLFLPLSNASGFRYSDNSATVSTLDEIKAEFADVVCKNDKRQQAVRALFEKMGAQAADIAVEKFGGVENLVVRKPGTTAETVIIGAHYDKVSNGCGAIDNWSGIVVMAHLYRSLRNVRTSKTLLFVAFGKEEQGLIGSHAMVKAINKEQAAQVCAMVNLDSFGMGAAQAAANMSSKKLSATAAQIAERMKIPFGNAAIAGAGADSMSFMDRGIPAITLHGLTNGWEKVLHTDNDKPAKVDAVSVYLGYRLALALTVEIINAPCGAWR
jgi:Zn-dependent M28 family amino/carboxypeptidase